MGLCLVGLARIVEGNDNTSSNSTSSTDHFHSLFGELIPEGSEAAFYALYAVTDKGSSVFGPVVVGAITDATGEIRPAFWFLAVLIALPIPLVYLVDVERGKREASALAKAHLSTTLDSQTGSRSEVGSLHE